MNLLDYLDAQPPAQQHSPTSVAAADAIVSVAGTLRKRVYDWLAAQPDGATDEAIQLALDMNPSTQRPRRIELVQAGLVRDSGRKTRTASGRLAVVWTVAAT